MKKLLPVLLALTLTLSLGLTAFAETYTNQRGGEEYTQTITVNAPDLTWTLEIPANLTIPFPDSIATTETPMNGRFKITDVSWDQFSGEIFGYILYDGMLWEQTEDPAPGTIEYTIMAKFYRDGNLWYNNGESDFKISNRSELPPTGNPYDFQHPAEFYGKQSPDRDNREAELYVRIAETQWKKAVPGATYQETVTYSSAVHFDPY